MSEMKQNDYKCLIDMDGVLTNWIDGVCKYANIDNPYDNPENYGIPRMNNTKNCSINNRQIYKIMDDYDFWYNLKLLKHSKCIINTAFKVFGKDNVSILSKPSLSSNSLTGKFDWLKKHFPEMLNKFIFGMDKSFCARKHNILLDDLPENTEAFTNAGGISFLMPAINNERHEEYLELLKSDDISEWLTNEFKKYMR